MGRRLLSGSLLVLTALGASCESSEQAVADRPPNFVVLFTDDQGWADVGVYGATGFQTPNLDRMASEGLRFSSFYSAQAVCSASRAGLLTGCYPNRVGISGALGPGSRTGLHADEETIAELLRRRGYRSGVFGKWHLGHLEPFLPLAQGFDEFAGLPYSNDMWPLDYGGELATSGPKTSHPPLPWYEGNEVVERFSEEPDQDTLTERTTVRALDFIERNAERPFFLYVPFSMPHVPLGVGPEFRGRTSTRYGDVMEELDAAVGRILEALRSHGLDERTLVVFTSDNGPWLNFGDHAGSVGPLREGKGTAFEGGQRVPCIARWPGRVPADAVSGEIASTIDLLPTLVELAGAPLPQRPIDGISLVPLLEGRPGARGRESFLYYYPQNGKEQLQAVREGRWKLHLPHYHRSYEGQERGTDGRPGSTRRQRIDLALFDLESDPGERDDLSEREPEVRARLLELAERARADLGDLDRPGAGTRAPGRVPPQAPAASK